MRNSAIERMTIHMPSNSWVWRLMTRKTIPATKLNSKATEVTKWYGGSMLACLLKHCGFGVLMDIDLTFGLWRLPRVRSTIHGLFVARTEGNSEFRYRRQIGLGASIRFQPDMESAREWGWVGADRV